MLSPLRTLVTTSNIYHTNNDTPTGLESMSTEMFRMSCDPAKIYTEILLLLPPALEHLSCRLLCLVPVPYPLKVTKRPNSSVIRN